MLPGCPISIGQPVHLDQLSTQGPPEPVKFHSVDDLVRAVYYMLHHFFLLETQGQQLQTPHEFHFRLVDGELTLMNEPLMMFRDSRIPVNNYRVAYATLRALKDVLVAVEDTNDEHADDLRHDLVTCVARIVHFADVCQGDLSLLMRKVKMLGSQPTLHTLGFEGKGNFGCVVGDSTARPKSVTVQKLLFAKRDDENLAREMQASSEVQQMDPGQTWSIVPIFDTPAIPSTNDLPMDTVAKCDPHWLPRTDIQAPSMPRAGPTLDRTDPRFVFTDAFIRALYPLFVGLGAMVSVDFAHLDIKGDNIIAQGGEFKYIDFGLSGRGKRALLYISSILNSPRYHYPVELYWWMFSEVTKTDPHMTRSQKMNALHAIFTKWKQLLPEVITDANDELKDARPEDLMSVCNKFFQPYTLRDLIGSISVWQLGLALATVIRGATTMGLSAPLETKTQFNDLQALITNMIHIDPKVRIKYTNCVDAYGAILYSLPPQSP